MAMKIVIVVLLLMGLAVALYWLNMSNYTPYVPVRLSEKQDLIYDPMMLSGRAGITEGLSAEFKLTDTVAKNLPTRPYLKSPLTIREIMAGGKPIADPGGVPGALRWDVPGAFNGSTGTWELVIDPKTNTVLHFLFKGAK